MAAISTVEYGDPATQKEMLDRLSPIYKLDRIKAATMVQHGANDYECSSDRGRTDPENSKGAWRAG